MCELSVTFDSSGDILQASDDLSRVINAYKKIVEGQNINGDSEQPPSTAAPSESGERRLRDVLAFLLNKRHCFTCPLHSTETTDTLIDLAGLDTPSPPQPAPPPFQYSNLVSTSPAASPIPVLPPPPKRLAGSHGSQSSSPSHPPLDTASAALSLLDDELLSLGSVSPIGTH